MELKITEYTLLADVKQNLRFAFLADLHNHPNAPILDVLQKAKVDAVLVGGDFIHNFFIYERGFEFLNQVSKILPTFCVLGNHERRYIGELRKNIVKSGAVLLDNDFCEFKGINIGGLTSGDFYCRNMMPNIDFLTRFSQLDGYKLLLCHHPEYYPKYIKDLPVNLTLSGHAHGGQWRIFGRGVYAPGQGVFPKYTKGLYDNRFIVTSGVGNVYLVPKINNPPEICLINLKAEK
jgi:predicted MPP superfamily phosphohydrolase